MTSINKEQPVVFTGAMGLVGRQVLPYIKDAHIWKLVDLRAGEVDGMPVHTVDITNFDQILETFAGSRAIVHSAIADHSNQGPNASEEDRAEYRRLMLEVNIKGTYNMYEAARILKIPKVVYISSMTVAMGRDSSQSDCSTKRPPAPVNFYACTKLFGEQTAEVYQSTYGIHTHVLRVGQPYPLGPSFKHLLNDPLSSSRMSAYQDIAGAIHASLSTDTPAFGIYNAVSLHSSGLTDHSNGAEIGFVPQVQIG